MKSKDDCIVKLLWMSGVVQGSCCCSGQFDSPLQQSLDWETIAKQFEGNQLFLTCASESLTLMGSPSPSLNVMHCNVM